MVLAGAGDHFCGGADIVARNTPGGDAAPRRQHPASGAVAGPPADPAAGVGAGAGGVRGAGLGGRHRLPAGAGGRLHDRGRRRPLLGAVHRARLHARQRRDLAAAAPGRSPCGPASCCCSDGRSAAPRPRSGGWSTGRVPAAEVVGEADALAASLAAGPTVALGLTKWLLQAGADESLDAQLRNEAFALELSSRSDDFREGLARLPGEASARVRGSMSASVGTDRSPDGPASVGDDRPGGGLPVDADTGPADLAAAVGDWVAEHVPESWRTAAAQGTSAIREVRTRADYEAWYPVFGRSGLVAPTWPVAYGGLGLTGPQARADRHRAGAVQPGPAQPARAQPGRAGPVRARHRGAAPPLPAADRPQRRGLVPAVQRARRRLRPGLARHPGRARRRRLDDHRAEGLDHLGPSLGLRGPAGPHRPRRAQAQGHHLLPGRPAPARGRGPAPAPHHRRDRLQRGLPRRRRGCPTTSGSARSATAGGWRTRRCRANDRWSRDRARAASTASADRAPSAWCAWRGRSRPPTPTVAGTIP